MTTSYYAKDPTEVRGWVSAAGRRRGERDRILRVKGSENEHWGVPGGYVEPRESVQSAAQREVWEETGYEIEVGRLVGVYSEPRMQVIDYGDGRRVHAINLCFEAIAGAERELGTPDETLDWGFFALDALPQPFVPIHEIRVSDAAQRSGVTRVR